MLSNWSKSFMDTKMTLVSDFWHLVIFRALCLAEDLTGGADFRLCGVAVCCSWVLSRWWTARSSLVVGECLLKENRPLSEERKLITREVLLLCACCGSLSLPGIYIYWVINIQQYYFFNYHAYWFFTRSMNILICLQIYTRYIIDTRPRDHKLRKFLSLKFDFEYLKFYWTHCFNNLKMWNKLYS